MDRIDRQGLKNLKEKLTLTIVCESCEKVLQMGDPGKMSPGICPSCYRELRGDPVSPGTAGVEKSLKEIHLQEADGQPQLNLFGAPQTGRERKI